MPHYKVIYFDARGFAEPIRQILKAAGQDFEDERLAFGTFTPEKKEELGLEWGQLPALEVDGQLRSQSFAICRDLARKYNLAGKDEKEQFRCDEVNEAARDFVQKYFPLFDAFFAKDNDKLEEVKKTVQEVEVPLYLARFEKMLEKNRKTYCVGDSLTYTDIILVHYITNLESAFGIQINKGPAVQKLIAAVQNEPKIKAWLQERPKTRF